MLGRKLSSLTLVVAVNMTGVEGVFFTAGTVASFVTTTRVEGVFVTAGTVASFVATTLRPHL